MIVIEHCAVSTVDAHGTEHPDGHVVVDGDRIVAVGPGPAPLFAGAATRIDGRGCLATPGLVNTHHHLYQWATRGYAQQEILFGWLTELYPVWAGIDAEVVHPDSASQPSPAAVVARTSSASMPAHTGYSSTSQPNSVSCCASPRVAHWYR